METQVTRDIRRFKKQLEKLNNRVSNLEVHGQLKRINEVESAQKQSEEDLGDLQGEVESLRRTVGWLRNCMNALLERYCPHTGKTKERKIDGQKTKVCGLCNKPVSKISLDKLMGAND